MSRCPSRCAAGLCAASRQAAMTPLSATSWLSTLGALGVVVVMVAEIGLLIGFFLPGDSVLFTAGLFGASSATAPVHLSLPPVMIAAGGALAGAQVGFVRGRRGALALLPQVRNRHLHAGLRRVDHLFARYGHAKVIVLARFIPVVRSVLTSLVGVLAVPARTVRLWQVIGGLVWSIGLTLAGYALGSSILGVDLYLLPAIAVIVLLSLIPIGLELRRARRTGHTARPTPGDERSTVYLADPER